MEDEAKCQHGKFWFTSKITADDACVNQARLKSLRIMAEELGVLSEATNLMEGFREQGMSHPDRAIAALTVAITDDEVIRGGRLQ